MVRVYQSRKLYTTRVAVSLSVLDGGENLPFSNVDLF
jgi:hypothetical protein